MFMKKMFIALKENIMLETMTEQLSYCKGNEKKSPHRKVDGIMKKTWESQIRVVPQQELQQRIEHITEQVNKSLKRLIS